MQQLTTRDKAEILDVVAAEGQWLRGAARSAAGFEWVCPAGGGAAVRDALLSAGGGQAIFRRVAKGYPVELDGWYEWPSSGRAIAADFAVSSPKTCRLAETAAAAAAESDGSRIVTTAWLSVPDGSPREAAVSSFLGRLASSSFAVRRMSGDEMLAQASSSAFGAALTARGQSRPVTAARPARKAAEAFSAAIWNPLLRLADAAEDAFFQHVGQALSAQAAAALAPYAAKGASSVLTPGGHLGGLVFRGFPRERIDVIGFLCSQLRVGESLSVHVYPGSAYEEVAAGRGNAFDGAFDEKPADVSGTWYVQMASCFREQVPYLLDTRCSEFLSSIGSDFYAVRADGRMSSFWATLAGTGLNALGNELGYPAEEMSATLLF